MVIYGILMVIVHIYIYIYIYIYSDTLEAVKLRHVRPTKIRY